MAKKKILLVVLIIVVGLFVLADIAMALFGKKIVESQIEKNLKMKARVGSISLRLPLSVKLADLEIGNLLKAKEIYASPSILGFLAGKVVLNKLTVIKPVINIEHSQDGRLNLPVFEQKGKQPPIILAGLLVDEGRFIFTDKKIDPQGYKTVIDKININISKVAFPPTSLYTRFKVAANITDTNLRVLGTAGASGWVDFRPKDMDGAFQIEDLEVTYFAPYYGSFISYKKLLSAKLNLHALLKAKDNDLNVNCHMELSDVVYASQEQKEEGKFDLDFLKKDALDLFIDDKGRAVFDFSFNTKLDNPAIKVTDLKAIIFKSAVKNLSRQNPSRVAEKVKGMVDQLKELGEGLKGIFKK